MMSCSPFGANEAYNFDSSPSALVNCRAFDAPTVNKCSQFETSLLLAEHNFTVVIWVLLRVLLRVLLVLFFGRVV